MRGLLAAWIARGRARRSPPPPRSSPAEDGTDHSRAGYSLRNRIRQAFIRLLAGSVGGWITHARRPDVMGAILCARSPPGGPVSWLEPGQEKVGVSYARTDGRGILRTSRKTPG